MSFHKLNFVFQSSQCCGPCVSRTESCIDESGGLTKTQNVLSSSMLWQVGMLLLRWTSMVSEYRGLAIAVSIVQLRTGFMLIAVGSVIKGASLRDMFLSSMIPPLYCHTQTAWPLSPSDSKLPRSCVTVYSWVKICCRSSPLLSHGTGA